MAVKPSPSTGKAYGVERVCDAWGVPRSSYYAHAGSMAGAAEDTPQPARPRLAVIQGGGGQTQLASDGIVAEARAPGATGVEARAPGATGVETRAPGATEVEARVRGRRGPKPPLSDDELLNLIRDDLADSPFEGEGHRKVYARLKRAHKKVSRKRVLRLMREHNLLSPYRVPKGLPNAHDGRICTDAPDQMYGTDGARLQTLEDGWVWLFIAVDHWNAQCVGWHVAKTGDRFAALEPVAQALQGNFGGTSAGVARGLSLRMDHGTQYTSDHFVNQVRHWGIAPSYAFVAEPQTNGVAERFIRTLKEQVYFGRIYQNLDQLRLAIRDFVDRYNRQWLVEKLRFRSPLEARQAYQQEVLEAA